MNDYRKTLEAVTAAKQCMWDLVDAIFGEIAKTESGSAKKGEFARCAEFLAEKGHRSWSAGRIRNLFQIGRWVNSHAGRVSFRKYAVESVIEARKAAGSDHERALEILSETPSRRAIRKGKSRREGEDLGVVEKPGDDLLAPLSSGVKRAAQRSGSGDKTALARIRAGTEELTQVGEAFGRICDAVEGELREKEKPQAVAMIAKAEERVSEICKARMRKLDASPEQIRAEAGEKTRAGD
jgi:hypothetical protein